MRILILNIMLLLIMPIIYSQGQYTTNSKKAIKKFEEGLRNYQYSRTKEALPFLLEAIKADNAFVEAHLLLADVYTDMGNTILAIEEYQKVISIHPGFFINSYYNLAKLQYSLSFYDEALVNFKIFETKSREGSEILPQAKKYILNCEFAIKSIANPVSFNPVNMGETVNSQYDEYLPAMSADENIFILTKRLPQSENSPFYPTMPVHEDFYISEKEGDKWLPAYNIGAPINTPYNEGAQCISADGNTIYFTACEREDGKGSCDIYISEKINGKWNNPKNLGMVNSPFWDSQPSIASDGKTLYFVSNRKGGKGKKDIWKAVKTNKGEWEKPVNLGDSINTEENEMSPFAHFDNQTFYFASDGHVGMGGYDLFISRKNVIADEWKKPVNMGYPINTIADENSLIVTSSGTDAYFAANREDTYGEMDIYTFALPEHLRPIPVTYARGRVTDKKSKMPVDANFELLDVETSRIVASAVADIYSGAFFLCVPANRAYALHVSKPGYLFYSENFNLTNSSAIQPFQINIPLEKIAAGSRIVLKNIFFESASAQLKPESKAELNKLIAFLNENSKVSIEISGHTDDVGVPKANQILSEERAESVFNYLATYKIDKERISAKGYGETKPIGSNESEDGRAMNRRTEIKIISVGR